MDKHITSWFSPSLQKEMPIVAYGYYGFSLLLIPTAGADYLEYERFKLIESIEPFINAGKLKVFSVNSINNEAWLNKQVEGAHKGIRQNQYNQYIFDEVVPFIKNNTSAATPIYTSGASFGALNSMNLFLKRPDLIDGAISMSGVYDLTEYSDGFWDDQVYFNSPERYLQNITDETYLNQIRKSKHIHILTGSGAYEDPAASAKLSDVMNAKRLPHTLDIWGKEWTHDWPTWRAMLPLYIDKVF